MDYEKFIEQKKIKQLYHGFEANNLPDILFPFQKHLVNLAVRKGRYAIFSACGTGKTLMQVTWADQIVRNTGGLVLILAPLAVSAQTINEGKKIGIEILKYDESKRSGIVITNYEQLEKIDCSVFSGVVLDESSILKNYSGAYRNLIINSFVETKYKLACTATPSPNDELEIGNHAEFLGVMTSSDMRAVFFVTDKDKNTGYRIKKHAQKDFYSWIGSWSSVVTTPSDIGFSDEGYVLPELIIKEEKIITDKKDNGMLFNDSAVSATDFNSELRRSMIKRLDKTIDIVNAHSDNCIIWVKHNDEADYLKSRIEDCREVRGSDTIEKKERDLIGFANNEFRVLITKTKIAQFGLNYQNCHNQIFSSFDFSFESLYQAIKRCHRFGQKNKVNITLITTDTMLNVLENIREKESKFNDFRKGVIENMEQQSIDTDVSACGNDIGKNFKMIGGDCIEKIREIESDSIDYTFFSPPFSSLYVFSDNPKDLSNVKSDDEFMEHFGYLIPELYRITKQGRLVSLHIMQGTTMIGRDGYYSIKDLRGEVIRLFQKHGFHFHGEHMIRKDPKTAAIRTKNRQLMHGTTKKDSSIVRPGLADYILSFKKPGENLVPVQNNIPFDLWCEMAEPVWIDINESDTLEYRSAKANKDERHITPTQLKPIEWCYMMYVNKDETVFCPFAGIGSEGVVALNTGRKYIGIELKKSYYDLCVKNLLIQEELSNQQSFI
jgi:DNA modification methylase